MTIKIDLSRGIYRLVWACWLKGKRVNSLEGWFAEVLFQRLHHVCDDFGVFEASPRLLRTQAFPMKEASLRAIADAIKQLVHVGLVKVYEIGGDEYGMIIGFEDFQPAGRNGRRISKFPQLGNPGESGGIQGDPGELGKSVSAQAHSHTHAHPHKQSHSHSHRAGSSDAGTGEDPKAISPDGGGEGNGMAGLMANQTALEAHGVKGGMLAVLSHMSGLTPQIIEATYAEIIASGSARKPKSVLVTRLQSREWSTPKAK